MSFLCSCFLLSLARFVSFLDLFKEKCFIFFHQFFCIVFVFLISLISVFYYFPSLGCFAIFLILEVDTEIIDFNISLFSDISIKCCEFSSQHYFSHVSQIFIRYIFIFVKFNEILFLLRFSLWTIEYLKVYWLVSNCGNKFPFLISDLIPLSATNKFSIILILLNF